MRPDYYLDNLRRYSAFLAYDTQARDFRDLIASGPLNDDTGWTDALMQNASWTYPHSDIRIQFFQGLSLHYYTDPKGDWEQGKDPGQALGFPEDQWFLTLRSPSRLDGVLSQHSAVMDHYDPQRKVALVVDEWGAAYAPEGDPSAGRQQNSLRDALLAALTFNVFHRHTDRVRMANLSMMINVLQAMILTDRDRMLVTSTYHVFDLYQPFQGATPYAVKVEGPAYQYKSGSLPALDISAARGRDGKLYLALVNLDPHHPAQVVTNLTGRAQGRVLTGEKMDAHNTFEAPEAIQPRAFSAGRRGASLVLSLPAMSVTVVAND